MSVPVSDRIQVGVRVGNCHGETSLFHAGEIRHIIPDTGDRAEIYPQFPDQIGKHSRFVSYAQVHVFDAEFRSPFFDGDRLTARDNCNRYAGF